MKTGAFPAIPLFNWRSKRRRSRALNGIRTAAEDPIMSKSTKRSRSIAPFEKNKRKSVFKSAPHKGCVANFLRRASVGCVFFIRLREPQVKFQCPARLKFPRELCQHAKLVLPLIKNPAQIYQTSGSMTESPIWSACIPNSIHVLEPIQNTQLQPTKSHPGML